MKRIRYTKEEAAEVLSCSTKTIDRLIENGKLLDSYKIARRVYISKKGLVDYLEKTMRDACVSEEHINEMKALFK